MRRIRTAFLLVAVALAIGSASASPVAVDSEVTVYVAMEGMKYHKSTCRYVKKSKAALTLEEAKRRGYEACKVCKPAK